MPKVWGFTSFSGGTGQSTFVLHTGLAAATDGVNTVIVCHPGTIEILARNIALPENLLLHVATDEEFESRIDQARAEGDLVLADCSSVVGRPEWCDHQAALICLSAKSISQAHIAVSESQNPIHFIASKMATAFHGERFLKQFQEVCGQTTGKTVVPLGTMPYSSLIKFASENGMALPGWLSWTPINRAFGELASRLKSADELLAEPFQLSEYRETEKDVAA